MIVPTEREIIDLIRKGNLEEAEQRIAALAHVAQSASIETTKVRERVRELEGLLAARDALSFDGQFYWTGAGAARAGPYCPTCFDAEHILLRLQFRTVEEIDYDTGYTRPGAKVFYRCTRCAQKSMRDVAP